MSIRLQFNTFDNINKIQRLYQNHKNYTEQHIHENKDIYMLYKDSNQYQQYISELFNNVEPTNDLLDILARHRMSILEESYQDSAIPYIGMLPIIISDIYYTKNFTEAISHKPISTSVASITTLKLQAKTRLLTGEYVTEFFPRANSFIKPKSLKISILPNTNFNLLDNVYGGIVVSNDKFTINLKEFFIESIKIENLSTHIEEEIPVLIHIDARNQLKQQIIHNNLKIEIFGNLNTDTGVLVYSFTISDNTFTVKDITVNTIFNANKTNSEITPSISLVTDNHDLIMDIEDDFKFTTNIEAIQDYTSLFNIDLIQTIANGIKVQMEYNEDYHLFKLLYSNISEFKLNNTYDSIDFQKYRDTQGWISPSFVSMIFQSILPRLIHISRKIFNNSYCVPTYLITGLKVASLLESIQEIVPNFNESYNYGKIDFHRSNLFPQEQVKYDYDFKILSSPCVDDNYIFIISKPVDDNNPIISEFIYKPLYIIQETTNSQLVTFMKSRKNMYINKPEACGVIKVTGLTDLISNDSINTENRKWSTI